MKWREKNFEAVKGRYNEQRCKDKNERFGPGYAKDFEIAVRNDEGKLGTLLISKENLEWLPKGNSVNKRRLSWKEFAEFMDQYGKPVISAGIYIVRLRNTGKRMSQFQSHGQMRRLCLA